MELLYKDVIINILNYANDFTKIKFTSTCKTYNCYKYLIKFTNKYYYDKIYHLKFFNNFTKIYY